jgi:hypothetical protein
MLNLGFIGFAAPWLLVALAALPILWWLLRVTPPAPREVVFPPLRLLLKLIPKEETPAHTPWWLLLLRLVIAALVILALAKPILNPDARLAARGPLVLVLDDGWAGAADWPRKIDAALSAIDQAERDARPVMVLGTAAPVNGEPMRPGRLQPAAEIRPSVQAWRPKPWPSDRAAVLRALGDLKFDTAGEVVWITDGIDAGDRSEAYTLAERLQWLGGLRVIEGGRTARALLPPVVDAGGMKVRVLRPASEEPETLNILASAEQARIMARQAVTFEAGQSAADIVLDLPLELRNRLIRLDIEGAGSAGGAVLLDERWRRRPVGLVSGSTEESRQPLLSDLYYLDRALAPFNEVRTGRIAELLEREIAMIALADIGQVVGNDRRLLEEWIEKGGVLLRFAGARMAESSDTLLPVKIRSGGGRQLGGAMSWSQPAKLANFPDGSPYFGLDIPADVTVARQVLAEPEIDLNSKTWARLEDGTPLVTAERRGKGWLVLFHTTSNTEWSNLAISGMFVDMLRRTTDLAQGVATTSGRELLPPLSLLDGLGRLGRPGPAAQAMPATEFGSTTVSPQHPPGFYGQEDARRALNLTTGMTELRRIASWPGGVQVAGLDGARVHDLLPDLLTAAIVLTLIDLVIAFAMRGLFRRARLIGATIAVAVLAGTGMPHDAAAQAQPAAPAPRNAEEMALQAATDMRLAYVITGNSEVDATSRAGLAGLSEVLFRRTAVEAAPPFGANLERDDIGVFPFLYWPMVPSQPDISANALARLDQFMKTGGLILFDTRDQGAFTLGAGQIGPGTQKLRQLLAKLDIPPLAPVPRDHVLTRAFYLMQDFPGRYAGGQLWVERNPGGAKDGVTSVVIGGGDWAAAWAIDQNGRPMFPLIPGTPTQREMAYRFGVNLVMYTLTGNYKADQVHVPALLERLGQ